MMNSVVIPPTYRNPKLRRYSYNYEQPPPLPPRPKSLSPPLKVEVVAQPEAMSSRYTRPPSPRGRFANPARSSTGTFDPYYDSTYYGHATSPRSSGERIGGSQYTQSTYAPSIPSSSRSSNLKYESYSGRPRRNTHTDAEDRSSRPSAALPPVVVALPSRTHAHAHHERPSSPLTRSRDHREDTYITHGAPHRREHKKIYSVDDSSHTAKLIAEKDVVDTRRRDTDDRGYSVSSDGRTYHHHKQSLRASDASDAGYSYTDPASMYRETEPAWRRPPTESVGRSSRPTSMILDHGPRNSARELGPPPSTRGFNKINNEVSRTGSHHRGRSPSLDRSRDIAKYDPSLDRSKDISKYDPYPEALPPRPSSIAHPHRAPAVHQEPRRDPYRSEYGRPDRDVENRRYAPPDHVDPDVSKRGFGIASPVVQLAQDPPYDRQPPRTVPEPPRTRPVEHSTPYYPTDRADARMPEPRAYRERDVIPPYEERPRERDREHRHSNLVTPSSTIPAVAGVAAGAAATLGAAGLMKSRGKDRDSERDREAELEREQRREWDERDRRDRFPDERRDDRRERVPEERRDRAPEERRERAPEERRDRVPEERRERAPEERRDRAPEERRDRVPEERRDHGPEERRARAPEEFRERVPEERRERSPEERHDHVDERRERPAEERLPPVPGGYPSTEDADHKPRERHYEDNERERRPRKAPSDEGSGDERPRHYVDPNAARENDRRKDTAPQEAPLDPDEEYRRRIQKEAERSGRVRDNSDSDRERERRRRREGRDKSRERTEDPRSRGSPSNAGEHRPRFEERSSPVLDSQFVQEPESMADEPPNRSVQIVTPPREPNPAPKGILRKPTEKFPELPEPIREGVAPHKSQMKGKDIPVNARWTKIDRKLVNPEALEQAKERFEERLDCVIVLRVLTKQEIQKLADRTKAIRESREEETEYEHERRDRHDDHHDHEDRDRRNRRSHRDEDDRDRRSAYDDSDGDDVGRARDRDRERDRPPMIEAGRPGMNKEVKKKHSHHHAREVDEDDVDEERPHDQHVQRDSSGEVDGHVHGHRHRRHRRTSSTDGEREADDKVPRKTKGRLSRVLDWL